ncbi:cobyric acid synthase [Chloroflexota bacterium]
MTAKTLMIQGTASSVGKSIVVTALCRIFHQDGYKVAPFKAQNMALNSFVTREGGEIGRSQVVQAEAAGIEPSVDMNPVLLKPQADATSQVIVLGKATKTMEASQYYKYTPYLKDIVMKSLNQLRSENDIVIIEGAGSPAEINLKEREIVNMWVARTTDTPVFLVGDIDRGGVFASIVGTLELVNKEERDLIKGIIINKFRGNLNLLKPGLKFLEDKTGKPVLGVLPYYRDIIIAQEDSVYLDERSISSDINGVDVAVIRLPRISNYDDFDPLETNDCTVRYITKEAELGNPDLIILPGTKSTIADLVYLRKKGLAKAIIRLAQAGTPIIGICGGYQMLGKIINDPDKVESKEGTVPGLGLLDIETIFEPAKKTSQITAKVANYSGLLSGQTDVEITGYEIHMGQTKNQKCPPAFKIIETPEGKADYIDGAVSTSQLIFGSYIHGLFHNTKFTDTLLNQLRKHHGIPSSTTASVNKDAQYDKLADVARQSLNIPQIYDITLGVKHE